ncbi:unnamed protein product [Adineta ricciae]|uniref:Uncharacterized protein n=1 Tax=Adineta ricciae TaxID=249248 RepID=A0A814D4X3_ADIRI|nr:unnamed protein product [Adineta ricciae]
MLLIKTEYGVQKIYLQLLVMVTLHTMNYPDLFTNLPYTLDTWYGMKKILFKLLSIKHNLSSSSKQRSIEKDAVVHQYTQHSEASSNVVHSLWKEESNSQEKHTGCSLKTKTNHQNSQQTSSNSNIDDFTNANSFSSNQLISPRPFILHNFKYQQRSIHLNQDKNLVEYDINSWNENQNKKSSTSVESEESKEKDDELKIRELVNNVRRDMNALVNGEQNDPSIVSADESSRTMRSSNRNINASRLKKSRKPNIKQKRRRKHQVKRPHKSRRLKKRPSKKKAKSKKVRRRKQSKSRKNKAKKKTKSRARKPAKSKRSAKNSKKHTSRSMKKRKAVPKPSMKVPAELPQCNNCCCNFLHYSLRQIMRDAEQTKQFALNMASMGINPSVLKDPNITSCQGISIPLYNCEGIGDQRFPSGATFTTISKNEQEDVYQRRDPMVVQTINTQRGKLHIKLDPQSFGLAPFFSQQYEAFIKGSPNSTFLKHYTKTFGK